MISDQNISHVRGDDLQVPVIVTLDQSRTLDGTETWLWVLRVNEKNSALVTKTSPTGVTIDPTTKQPTVVLEPADFPDTTFPDSTKTTDYVHELEMTKDSKVETVTRGTLTLTCDIAF